MICYQCKKTINSPYFILESKNQFFCSKKCFEDYGFQAKEEEDRLRLIEYIKFIFHFEKIPTRILGEIKRFHEKEQLSYNNIRAICHYIYEVKQFNPYGETIYQVSQYKNEAERWYKNNALKAQQIKTLIAPKEEKIVKPQSTSIRKQEYNIDINDI